MTKRINKKIEAPARVPLTRAERVAMVAENLNWDLKNDAERSEKTLAEFAVRVQKDPAGALEWSKGAFEAAASLSSARTIVALIENIKSRGDEYVEVGDLEVIKALRAEFYDAVMRGAKWPSRSTSVQSNEMELELTARRAEWLEKFDQMIAFVERTED